jgi:hypothetical protein
MGAGMIFILFLIIVAAVIAAVAFTGTGARVWAKKTAPPASQPDAGSADQPIDGADEPDAASAPESTVAPDERGIYHRESR